MKLIQTVNKLIYFSDPMCSWCYGLKPELDKLREYFAGELEVEIIMGGLRPKSGQPWTSDFKKTLRSHWGDVQRTSGQPFSYKLLELPRFDYNTEPACRAVCVIKKIKPEATNEFLSAIQHMFYAEGEDPTVEEFYKPILNTLNIDQLSFFDIYRSEAGYLLAEEDFRRTAQYRVRGFPSLLADIGDRIYPVTFGYASFQMMRDRVQTFMQRN